MKKFKPSNYLESLPKLQTNFTNTTILKNEFDRIRNNLPLDKFDESVYNVMSLPNEPAKD